MSARVAKHSSSSMEHGTPAIGVELAQHTLGRIDLDPASSSYWNRHTVRAARYYDRRRNGLKQPWSGTVFCNPPGADEAASSSSLVRPFWARLVDHWTRGALDGAIWWGYSLEQLQMLQSSAWDPLRCVTLLLEQRPRHMVRVGSGAPVEGASPTHAGYVTLLPSRRGDIARLQIARFRDRGEKLGRVVRPM